VNSNCEADGYIANVHCMMDKYNYKHKLRICNTYCFSTNNNGSTKASHCYVIPTLSVLMTSMPVHIRYSLFKNVLQKPDIYSIKSQVLPRTRHEGPQGGADA
jgi:hypothetical protein